MICLVFAGLLSTAPAALAQEGLFAWETLLHGDYVFTQQNTCVETVPGGFDRDTLQLLEDAEITTFTTRAVTSFDGNGNVSVTDGEGMVIFQGQTSAGDTPVLAPIRFTCEGSYTIESDRSFQMEVGCQGSEPPFLENEPHVLNGHVSQDRKTLVITGTQPVIEELSIPGAGVIGERICIAIATDVRIRRDS
jgi:hypothetical protein